jgi:beta-glucosidase
MKKLAITLTAMLAVTFPFAQTDLQKMDALLKKMTLEEKVGQMTQVTLGVVCTPQDGVLDMDKLKHAIVDYKVGSILNVTGHALTVDQWHTVITQIQDETKNTRLKIPVIYGLDGIHGQTYTLDATLFPQSIALAATRNTALAVKAAKITAMELRASGVRWNFAPVLDCGRQAIMVTLSGNLW